MRDRLLELKAGQPAVRVQSGLGSATSPEEANGTAAQKKSSKAVKNEQQKMDEMFKEAQKIRIWIEEIEEDTKAVKRLHAVVLHSPRTDQATKDRLEETMGKIRATSVKAKNGIKFFAVPSPVISGIALEKQIDGKVSHLLKRMMAIQHSTLSKRYQTAMLDYHNTLVSYKQRCETHIKTQLRIVGTQVGTNEELETLLDKEDTQVFVGNYMKETQEARQALLDAKCRHKELQQVEKSITELNELFIDVATLIQSQGEIVDQIEYNVEHGVNFVSDGTDEVGKANRYKQKARKKKYLLIMCLITVILIIILLIVVKVWLNSLF